MELVYCGPAVPPGTAIPLPEGWAMAGHNEPDASLAAEKVASGKYRYAKPPKAPKPEEASKEKEA